MKSLDRIHKHLYINLLCLSLIVITLFCGSLKSYTTEQLHKPVVIEIVYPGGQIEYNKLISFCSSQQFIDTNDLYQWKNHLVIYGNGYERFYVKIKSAFKNCEVKLYDHPFYNFNRKYCSNPATAKHWKNIILTANLVKDPKMQQQYLEYHRTQFEKWPEVSNGFCHANFQQLLVFKNGRQLMLVISIPKGESLDKLNPKTTENNPRVNDWNNMMKKYQVGIPGTKNDEVWVFLKPL